MAILLLENVLSSLLILALFLLLQQDRPPEKCSLTGTVVDSVTGAPLNKVEVRLEPLDHKDTHVAVTKSDAEGRFAMVDLDPGVYRLTGKRRGYLEMSYGTRRPGSDGSLLRFDAGRSLNGIEFKLIASAVIAGAVRDGDGEPMEGAHVTLARFTYEYGTPRVEGYDSTNTDDRGEYRFTGLGAGKYYIGVEPVPGGWNQVDHSLISPSAEPPLPTLYPGVADLSMAVPVEVTAGSHVMGIDVTPLRSRVFRVRGRVVNGPATGRLTVVLHDSKNAGVRDHDLRTPTLNTAGDFELRGVPPGSYELTAADESLCGRVPVTVGASDLDGVRLPLAPGAEIRLNILTVAGDKPGLSSLGFILTANGRSGFGSSPLQKERFLVHNVPPDHYALHLFGDLLRTFYVKTARAGDADVLADGLTVTGGGTIEIEMRIAPDGARVEGVVRDRNDQTVPGATIVLAPDVRSRADLFKSTTSDQDGHFELTAIAPASYKLFAWDEVEPEAWTDPGLLSKYEKQGEKIALETRARATVSVRLMTRPDAE